MRLLPVLVLVAGCGFQVTGASSGDDAPPPPPDDAEVDMPPDMPVDMSCADTDGDGVCDEVDRCPQGDDRVDADGDGIPDACDDWPCGAKPAAPPAVVSWNNGVMPRHENVTISNVRLDDMDRKFLVVAPNAAFEVSANYSIFDCNCDMGSANCIDQIQLGLWPGEDTECIYNGNPGGNNPNTCTMPTTGSNSAATLLAPPTRGSYDIRFRRANGLTSFCNSTPNWWDPPTPDQIIAYVCVD